MNISLIPFDPLSHVLLIMWSVVVLCSWGPINNKVCSNDDDVHDAVEVEDTEVVHDKMIAEQSDEPEKESTSPKPMAVESAHERDNDVKDFSSQHSKDNVELLEVATVPFDSVSLLSLLDLTHVRGGLVLILFFLNHLLLNFVVNTRRCEYYLQALYVGIEIFDELTNNNSCIH